VNKDAHEVNGLESKEVDMQEALQTGKAKWRKRIAPSILGFVFSLCLIFLGASSGAGPRIWFLPATFLLLLAVLALARRLLPRVAAWCEAGISFLLATITGALLISGVFAAFLLANFDTEYAPGYAARAFDAVKLGDTREAVVSRLGEPLSSYDTEPYQQWIFSDDQQPSFSESGIGNGTYTTFTFDSSGRVKNVAGQTTPTGNTIRIGDGENFLKLKDDEKKGLLGKAEDAIRTRFGQPVAVYDYRASKVLHYSRSPSISNYHLRELGLDQNGMVVHIRKSIYWD
jgi:hypothetical protein